MPEKENKIKVPNAEVDAQLFKRAPKAVQELYKKARKERRLEARKEYKINVIDPRNTSR